MSELFGASNDLLSTSSSTGKPTVRALTFDGKAIFFKKKAPKRNAEAVSGGSRYWDWSLIPNKVIEQKRQNGQSTRHPHSQITRYPILRDG